MITVEQLIIKVAELALRTPDFVYRSCEPLGRQCLYIAKESTGTPACIFGQAFTELEVSLTEYSWFKEGMIIEQVVRLLGIEASYEQKSWMKTIQEHQDRGWPWGECLLDAKNTYPNILVQALRRHMGVS